MGKSPGRWLKTVLLGKKSSKSSNNLSKGRDASKSAKEKETWVTATPTSDLVISPPLLTQPAVGITDSNDGKSVPGKGTGSSLPHEEIVMSPKNQDAGQGVASSCQLSEDQVREEQAATKAQAAFRGYLARRAFRALRGIIRLQALIRGHLVRRQAVVTLRCMQGIVKLQALARGQKVKLSNPGLGMHRRSGRKAQDAKRSDYTGVNTSGRKEKLPANAFVIKLLGSSSTMPLRLHYGQEEPNSAWVWLQRWTSSRFWVPLIQPKKAVDSKSQLKQGAVQNVASEASRSKRVVRKAPTANVDTSSILSTSDSEKPKRYLRKSSSHQVDPVQENPQNELEKVKRNLRKVSNSTVEATDQPEVETEKPKRSLRKPSNHSSPDIIDHSIGESADKKKATPVPVAVIEQPEIAVETEKPNPSMIQEPCSLMPDAQEQGMDENCGKLKDTTETVFEQPATERALGLVADGPVDVLNDDHPLDELPPKEISGKDVNVPVKSRESVSKEDQTSNENQKSTKRRASFPAKQDNLENGLQNTPPVPSYMAATESAKAKLRAQGSPRFGQDVIEKNGFTRRHSLPSNGKLNSPSPRTQKAVYGSGGKGGTKNDRSLSSSRDGNEKAVQAEWRR